MAFLQRHLGLVDALQVMTASATEQDGNRKPGPMSPDKATLMARFDNPKDHLPASGAGGTEWDAQYRRFIQTDEAAVSKGLPTHADAAQAILSFLQEQLLSASKKP